MEIGYQINLFLKNKHYSIKINKFTKFTKLKSSLILKGVHILKNKFNIIVINKKINKINFVKSKNKTRLFSKKINLITKKRNTQIYIND